MEKLEKFEVKQVQKQKKTPRTIFNTYNFALIICRNPKTGKYLAVDESRNRGWWIPGGAVDGGETFNIAAHRECWEEAGVKIRIKGILNMDYQLYDDFQNYNQTAKMRVIFYAEPLDVDAVPKQIPDHESNGAAWLTLDEFRELKKQRLIRGDELLIYGKYLEEGGQIFPCNMIQFISKQYGQQKKQQNDEFSYDQRLDPKAKAFAIKDK